MSGAQPGTVRTGPAGGAGAARPGVDGWAVDPTLLQEAVRLHTYLVDAHLRDGAIQGPDAGIRVNYRVGRFVKGWLPFVPWRDRYAYLQAQGYWALANWALADLTGDDRFVAHAVAVADWMVAHQRPDGAWTYPNREWAGRVATAEGTWASLGLVETYRRTGEERFLAAAQRWNDHLTARVRFQPALGGLAVNYFAERQGDAVPNNTAFVLRFLAALADATGAPMAEETPALVRFLAAAQRPSGELPYAVADEGPGRPHFQCVQYNAFQALDLLEYHRRTGDPAVVPIIERLAVFLRAGGDGSGRAYYDCRHGRRAVVYHAAARAAALAQAARLCRVGGAVAEARCGFAWVLRQQRGDGSLPFSVRERGVLHDGRAYPRNLAMVAYHLLTPLP